MPKMESAVRRRRKSQNRLSSGRVFQRLQPHEINPAHVAAGPSISSISIPAVNGNAELGPAPVRRVSYRCIESEEDVRAGLRSLRRRCEVMRRIHKQAGEPPLRRRAAGFEGLARIIVGQQVSVASAEAIWVRFEQAVRPLSPEQLLLATDADLRRAGLSQLKMRTLRAASEAIVSGLDLAGLDAKHDEEVRATLMAISGIGPWTADIYLMFCLGRADAFAAGDLALQIAAQHAFALPERPDARQLDELAQRWRPWRGVAARLLWTYYRGIKAAKSGAPI